MDSVGIDTSLNSTVTSDKSSSPLGSGDEGEPVWPPSTTEDARSAVLGNEDLLNLIFSSHVISPFFSRGLTTTVPSQIDGDPSTSTLSGETHRKLALDLLHASLTCKAFFCPAVRALWQSLDSIVPLVKLICKTAVRDGVLTTGGVISEAHLQRFDYYARFVRRFELSVQSLHGGSTATGLRVAAHIFPIIHVHRPHALLPSLKVLEIRQFRCLQPEDIWLLNSIVPSTLSQLIVKDIRGETLLAASILTSVRMKCPRLTALSLVDFQLDGKIFGVLKKIDTLESLNISHGGAVGDTNEPAQSQNRVGYSMNTAPPFGDLVNLRLCGSASVIRSVIRDVFRDVPQLKSLNISLVHRGVESYAVQKEALVLMVEEIVSRENLFLESFMIVHESSPAYQIPVASLKNFNRPIFEGLKAFKLSIPVDNLSHESLLTLFATPHQSLVSLDLSGCTQGGDSWGILKTVRDMVPGLKHLSIPILLKLKPDTIGYLKGIVQLPPTVHGLKVLRLKMFVRTRAAPPHDWSSQYPNNRSPWGGVEELLLAARYVDHLFPNLQKINTDELRSLVKDEWLDGFVDAVRQFGEVRKMSDG